MYKENPKTKGSGIVCSIPQTGTCPNNCEDCFFQSGRSYLEPLKDNLPNMPDCWDKRVVRINDGNDSNVNQNRVLQMSAGYPMKFYNTAIPKDFEKFNEPIVLTVNPGKMTNGDFHRVFSKNIMFVRARVNTWNLEMIHHIVQYYGDRSVPIVLTFMAYFGLASLIPEDHRKNYIFRKWTLNSYNAITTKAWREVMRYWENDPFEKWVYSCGKIEGENGTTACRFCGNCLREYYATKERIRGNLR